VALTVHSSAFKPHGAALKLCRAAHCLIAVYAWPLPGGSGRFADKSWSHTHPTPTLPPLVFRSEERREVLLCCRGTFSPEDAFVDLLATGAGGLVGWQYPWEASSSLQVKNSQSAVGVQTAMWCCGLGPNSSDPQTHLCSLQPLAHRL